MPIGAAWDTLLVTPLVNFLVALSALTFGSFGLAILLFTVIMRAITFPLTLRTLHSMRAMQTLQPRLQEVQKKYSDPRRRSEETMKLYRETGTNPLASCGPLILQMPIFLALFRTLNEAANEKGVGFLSDAQAKSLADATIFGVVKISDTFMNADSWHTQLVAGLLVIAMTLTTFTTQRQLMRKNMPESALTGQYAQTQKLLLYVLPIVFAVGGVAFPIGVLLYWTTSNLWTMGQQFYVIRNNPTPGTPAFEAKKARDAKKHPTTTKNDTVVTDADDDQPAAPKPPSRVQPKKQSRAQRKRR